MKRVNMNLVGCGEGAEVQVERETGATRDFLRKDSLPNWHSDALCAMD